MKHRTNFSKLQKLSLSLLLLAVSACNSETGRPAQNQLSSTAADSQTSSDNKDFPESTPSEPTRVPSPSATPVATPAATPAPVSTPVPSTSQNYPSCVSSDPNHICIGLKIVSYQDASGTPVLSESDAVIMVNQMNDVWSQCNIAFQLELYQLVNPVALGLSYSPNWQTESDIARRKFKDASRFLVVAVGPWNTGTIAVTQMPRTGLYGTLVDKQFAHNALTVGHELGHYQGLYHVEDTTNLMSAYIGNYTQGLTTSQCSTSRSTDNQEWKIMMRKPI